MHFLLIMHATFSAHLVFLALDSLIVSTGKQIMNFFIIYFFPPSFLGSYIFLKHSHSIFSLELREQASHPCETTVSYISVFRFLVMTWEDEKF